MSGFLALKVLHIVGAAVLLGTGAGIAFFMLMAHRTRDPRLIAHTAGVVVIADALFTATAVVLQPITGALLAGMAGYPLFSGWIAVSLALYLLVGACWLPVVWIQLKFRDLARTAVSSGAALGEPYDRLFRLWLLLGVPAFTGVIAIIGLMVAKPPL
jgi:uncharacterized membrane protein